MQIQVQSRAAAAGRGLEPPPAAAAAATAAARAVVPDNATTRMCETMTKAASWAALVLTGLNKGHRVQGLRERSRVGQKSMRGLAVPATAWLLLLGFLAAPLLLPGCPCCYCLAASLLLPGCPPATAWLPLLLLPGCLPATALLPSCYCPALRPHAHLAHTTRGWLEVGAR